MCDAMTMLRTLPLAFLAVPAMVSAAPAQDLALVQQHLKAVGSMTANFTQSSGGQTLNGTLQLKRPGRVRFQYGRGANMLLVSDGKALTFIDYDVKQVQRYPIGDNPLSILLNPDQNISRFAKVVPGTAGGALLVEARDPKRPEYGTITMAFARVPSAPAGLMLQGWSVVDAQGRRTTIRLSNQRFNVPVAESAFRWTDPRASARGPRG